MNTISAEERLPVLLPEEINSIRELAQQITAFPNLWESDFIGLLNVANRLKDDAAMSIITKHNLSSIEQEILKQYYGK